MPVAAVAVAGQGPHTCCPCLPACLPAGDNPDQSQIVCNGCRVLLSYPRGAQSVECSICHIVTQASLTAHALCQAAGQPLHLGADTASSTIMHAATAVQW